MSPKTEPSTQREDVTGPVWLTPDQAAPLLGMTPRHIRNLCRDGLLEARDFGIGTSRARWRIRPDDLEDFIAFRHVHGDEDRKGTEGNRLRRGAVSVKVTTEDLPE